jgi:hypothetical protein
MISSKFIIQGGGGQSCRIISDKRQGRKMWKTRFCAKALAVSLVLAFAWSCGSGVKTPLLGKETVKGWLSDPEVIILDVRASKDWNVSDKKIKGAERQDPDEVKIWAADLPKNKKIVLY